MPLLWLQLRRAKKKTAKIQTTYRTLVCTQKFEIVPFFGVGWFDTYVPKSIGLGLSSQFDGGRSY